MTSNLPELPEPRHVIGGIGYTADQLREYALKVRDEALSPLLAEVEALREKSSAQDLLIKSLQEQRSTLRKLDAEGREARETLGSERRANAILTAEVEALRKDAERYRWLRERNAILDNDSGIFTAIRTTFPSGEFAGNDLIAGDEMDAAIDSALQSQGKGSQG